MTTINAIISSIAEDTFIIIITIVIEYIALM